MTVGMKILQNSKKDTATGRNMILNYAKVKRKVKQFSSKMTDEDANTDLQYNPVVNVEV